MNALRSARRLARWPHPVRRVLVADAGLVGLRTALFAGLAAAGAAALAETARALVLGGGPAPVVVAGLVAAIGSTQLSGDPLPRAGRLGVGFGLVAGFGSLVGSRVAASEVVLVVALVVVTALAVAARRWGPAGAALGIAGWLGVVVTATLHAQGPTPEIGLATACGLAGLWLGLLAGWVFRARPRTSALLAVRGVVAACEDALDGVGRGRRAEAIRLDLLRTALVADAHLQRAAPVDGDLVRERVVQAHQAADRLLARDDHDDTEAALAVRRAARRLRAAATALRAPSHHVELADGSHLAHGSLPGATGLAARVPYLGRHARPTVGAITRQTVQAGTAALAAALVSLPFSGGRITWSVLAAFTTLGAAHASSGTLRKAVGRMAGTALGVAIGLAVGVVLAGVPVLAVVVVAGLAAFWVQARHYVVAITCATVVISALYRGLGAPVADLLTLRLADTVVGAGCAIAVTALLWPLRGRSVSGAAEHELVVEERAVRAAVGRSALAAAVVRVDAAGEAVLGADLRRRRSARAAVPLLDRLAESRALLDDDPGPSEPRHRTLEVA